ncbi:MAG: broad specificity phosphatase PhoE [Cellvibrionaceae bacterium]|jgi:broad specificity phosphatase PhoE
MTHFILVRHGQTEWNRIRRIQGQLDSKLDETGRKQAQLVGKRLASETGISAIYASDLSRAMDTAQSIAAHHPSLVVQPDQRMREITFGPWEGKQWDEFEADEAEKLRQWRSDVTSITIPGIEPIETFAARVRSFIDEMVERHPDGKIVVVAHGGSVNMFLTVAMEFPLRNCWRMKVGNTAIAEIYIFPEGPFLEKTNDTHHLDGVDLS